MSMVNIKLLHRYRVDREAGMTADGSTELVVLIVKPIDGHDLALAMSKADAMAMSMQLQLAATEAQATMHSKS